MARPAALQQPELQSEGGLQFVIITGLSGAGKSNAMKVFEDLGYFCVDNLPPALLPKFAELCLQSDRIRHVAVAIDVRGGEFFNDFFSALDQLAAFNLPARILFLDASDEVLVRRYEETRRKHPLAQAGGILEGIREERRRLEAVKERAHWVVDTSTLTVRELRDAIVQTFLRDAQPGTLSVTMVSFGYKYGIPLDADMVLDVRFLPNPHYHEALRPLPGSSPPVREFVLGSPATQEFLRRVRDLLDYLLPQFVAEGKAHLTVAVGCTGGKHRSVVLVDELAAHLSGRGYRVAVRHRDVGKE